ncbi:hypothetical protein AB4Y72_14080 [Arthrobacter sp. YAF34]|uniref:hypothetical protein n=1 Tax=Arthrobacter sp. YAF34 TaxID=3233083 RepID=UPI003F90301C
MHAIEDPVEAAELAVFARKSQSLAAAAAEGLPGKFESHRLGGLKATIATADQFDFLNTIEGVTDQSVAFVPDLQMRFANPQRTTIIATHPSQELVHQLRNQGYEPTAPRPIAYLSQNDDFRAGKLDVAGWQVHEVSTKDEATLFMEILEAGYAATSAVAALIRAEHALPSIRRFIARRDNQPLAAAAMSIHATGAVLGGACTLSTARGAGAQSALLSHRLRLAESLNIQLSAATAAPGSPSIRNLAKLGFTIVERTAWRRR